MAQLILNNNDYAEDFRTKLNDNFTELFNNNVPVNHANATEMYGLGTGTLFGHLRATTGNGLNLTTGTLSLSQATTAAFGSVRLAANASSTSTTDVITGAILNSVTRGQGGSGLPMIFNGTSDPTSTNPANAQDNDIYVKYA